MVSLKLYGKYGFLVKDGWTKLADCLAEVFAHCWMYFKLLFKPQDDRTYYQRDNFHEKSTELSCIRQVVLTGSCFPME